MLFHLSIDADRPRHVAQVLAEIWEGDALPFPPVEGSWMAFANDGRATMIEVYPRGTELNVGPEGGYGVIGNGDARSATHFAMSTDLSQEHVLAIAAREGWPAMYRRRADKFGLIEMWVEGVRMVEVLTPEMQAEYVDFVTVDNWRAMLVAGASAREAA